MRIINVIILLALVSGCESIVNFPEIPTPVRYPVIEAVLTNQNEAQKLRISYPTALNDSLNSLPVSNARVYVFSDSGDTFIYHYMSNGWYASDPFHAIPAKTYTLNIQIDSSSFMASGSLIPLNGIDSLYFKHLPNAETDSAYFVYANAGAVDPTITKYYQINIYRNDSLLTGGTNIAIFNDKFLNALNEIKLPFTYSRNDTVLLELFSLSKEMYSYYEALTINIFSLDFINIGYRTNPPQIFNKLALGYFQVSAVDRKKIIIH